MKTLCMLFSLLGGSIAAAAVDWTLQGDLVPDGDHPGGFGSSVSMSASGRWVAVPYADSKIDVYHLEDDRWLLKAKLLTNETFVSAAMSRAGAVLAVQTESHLTLYTIPSLSVVAMIDYECLTTAALSLTDDVLVVGCGSWNDNRGRVSVYQAPSWSLLLQVNGDNIGDRWGTNVAWDPFMTEGGRLGRLAVGAPGHDMRRGLVRVVDVWPNGQMFQIGKDLTGDAPTEQFGLDLALSATSDSRLAVGTPMGSSGGKVTVYAFQRTLFGTVFWQVIDELSGELRWGAPLAVTLDARRLVIGAFRHDNLRGRVEIWQWSQSLRNYELQATCQGESDRERLGNSVAMNDVGSIVAVGAPYWKDADGNASGRIRFWLDQTPFCSRKMEQPFVARQPCGDTLDEATCLAKNGPEGEPCVWAEARPTSKPSTMLSTVVPTQSMSPSPTDSPKDSAGPTPSPSSAASSLDQSSLVDACVCNVDGECTEQALLQGQELRICIRGRHASVQLLRVNRLELSQGSALYKVIGQGGSRRDGVEFKCSNNRCDVRTTVELAVFAQGRPDSLLASGTASVFYSVGLRGRRRRRRLQDVTASDFEVQVALERYDDDEPVALSPAFWITTLVLIGLTMVCCCILTRRRQQRAPTRGRNET